jgi:hypothetical protein
MAAKTLTQMQQSTSSPALPGTWKIAAGRAITLRPREAGVLRVAHGQLWVTFDGPHDGPLNDRGDRVIGLGEPLRLRAGQRLVAEPWKAAAYFSWDPEAVAQPRIAPRRVAAVVQPLADLRLALVLGAGAARRLASGLAGLAWALLVTGLGRDKSLADCAFNAQSSACRAHGAMN